MTWRAVDGTGLDLATGRPPRWPGHPTPAGALAAAPVVPWPVAVAAGDGRFLGLRAALGPGGERVERLVAALAVGPASCHPAAGREGGVDVDGLARSTPGGRVNLPVDVVDLATGVAAAGRVHAGWLARVEGVRAGLRRAAVEAGRGEELEAAVHVAVLVATERLDPADDADVEAHVASGAQLWLVAAAVAAAVAGADPDPFGPWARLVTAGLWPVGPCDERLVVSAGGRR